VSEALQALYAGEQDRALSLLPADDELSVFEAAAFGRTDRLRSLLSRDSTQANAVSEDASLRCIWPSSGSRRRHFGSLSRTERISMRPRLRRLLRSHRWERLHSSARRPWQSYCLKRALIPLRGARRHSRPQRRTVMKISFPCCAHTERDTGAIRSTSEVRRVGMEDRWSRWITERRFAGDPATREEVFTTLLVPIRERVLDAAEPIEGSRVLDVGCGDGLIAFGALDRQAATVVFTDISRPLLEECRQLAEAAGVTDRCEFIEASAEDLSPVPASDVDIVTVRSVLMYVREKAAAFAGFARVLRPGGRLSIFEPINRFGQQDWQTDGVFFGADVRPVAAAAAKLQAFYKQFIPDDDPMLDFDERDLITLAEQTGFEQIYLTLTAEVRSGEATPWEVFVNTAGSPNLPTPAEAIRQALTGTEAAELTTHLRPLIEQGTTTRRTALAYLRATRADV
jgi:arsenite methyltransferase